MTSEQLDPLPTGDPQAIARLRKWGGETLVLEMVVLFGRHVPGLMRTARASAARGECAEAARAAHTLKSSCAQLGAARMRIICEQVERLAAGGALASLPELLDDLEAEFASFTSWLETVTTFSTEPQHAQDRGRRGQSG